MTGNTVTVDGSPTTGIGAVLGAFHNAKGVSNNTVTINGGDIAGVIGGFSENDTAKENSVTINGGTVGDVMGGHSKTGTAEENTITINGGTISGYIDGGIGYQGSSHNTIVINGGTILSKLVASGTGFHSAINNTLTINKGVNGNPTFGADTILYGGVSDGDDKTGNTLNLHTTGLKVNDIAHFENLRFFVQEDTPKDSTFLTLSTDKDTDITGTKIGVGVEGNTSLLKDGDKLVLIKKEQGELKTDATLTNTVTGMQGIAVKYVFELEKQDNQTLIAKAKSGFNSSSGSGGSSGGSTAGTVHPQTKSLLESGLAGLNFINNGADLVDSAMTQLTPDDGIKTFGAIRGGKYRTETGSHIDVKGTNLLVGVGRQAGQFQFGTYVEAGFGSYDSENDIKDTTVTAEGDTKYYGIGATLKQAFNRFFVEGGLRLGHSQTTYNSDDFEGSNTVKFTTKRAYAGANFGVGYNAQLSDAFTLTPYGKVFYTYLSNEQQHIEGSLFKFDSVRSLRTQLGAKMQYQLSDKTKLYSTLAWENEAKGKATGTVLGFDMPSPSLKGNTGIVEFGVTFTPSQNLSINLGATGNFGKRRGASANALISYGF
ncbi:autotransporter outer membrane beta-barrel domain-containing protein [Pasteurella skyensis]|uniref:autotransporter outer membrane beta-barrel domain-containing protein n=1 Tax=Phocoenobacter skyensis TaxID=97481 RepID=UPI0027535398|nr:autotransporter outer membrane beta-barrel domain-containing protein [Pasteurella skyensis]MDP8161844.1 autotransporter outer membrane beta-barrel domain-containing protein [Pasteurella skyensis]MDP8176235.1 autotransporter outer membrane beta-barrel domain-containing protein [Pasteurella skyensis]MDP8182137.1 autotransporter outer membrane beta-barrel domain-containing protein [Pasteurella skyensis]MDP8188562.1 autotransporter outer membrane beta-barrel domain-containing protein [Pasteurell